MKRVKLIISFGILIALLFVSFGFNLFQYNETKKLTFEKDLLISKKDKEIKTLREDILSEKDELIYKLEMDIAQKKILFVKDKFA